MCLCNIIYTSFVFRIEEQMAKDNLDAINNMKDVQFNLKKKHKQIANDLCAQISELDRKNKEAESLRAEETRLQEHNLLLLNMVINSLNQCF